jgi:hypothetical protein
METVDTPGPNVAARLQQTERLPLFGLRGHHLDPKGAHHKAVGNRRPTKRHGTQNYQQGVTRTADQPKPDQTAINEPEPRALGITVILEMNH